MDLRNAFLSFFKEHGHEIVGSSSLIPSDDPTLLFTNAGMNQFKKVFLGLEVRPYSRAASCQKCLRVGGKHNDLENVGFTNRHHTFFEMLGNFSFGDYFKKEAIVYAWEFLTRRLQLPAEKLYVSVFENDDEAFEIWHKTIGLSQDRIVRLGEKDNFWRMGDIGPCGPSTEIYFYHQIPQLKSINPVQAIRDGHWALTEVWNLVFMQYDEREPGQLLPLPKPSVDTGAGLERLMAVLEGHWNNFRTSLFLPILEKAAHLSNQDLTLLHRQEDLDLTPPKALVALRVLADHVRSTSFLIHEGLLPGNEGRAYVLRRIMRRAIRWAYWLDPKRPIFSKLVEPLIQVMGSFYPELVTSQAHIQSVIETEENKFLELLEKGLALFETKWQQLPSGARLFPGEVAFELYDTYGFPLDLTQMLAMEKGLEVDLNAFHQALEKARLRSQQNQKFKFQDDVKKQLGQLLQQWPSELSKPTKFLGYEVLETQAQVLAYANLSGKNFMVVDVTPFYGLGGGQEPDIGVIIWNQKEIPIEQVYVIQDVVFHELGSTNELLPSVGETIILRVDGHRRMNLARNHSATHLLHAALRTILGPHVKQAGSHVSPEYLRFDFTHPKPLSDEEIIQVQNWVMGQILENLPTKITWLPKEKAIEQGALAFFEEKYHQEVRVVQIGSQSLELCGGTHVQRTGDIGLFVVVDESSVSSGIRRIEALTGQRAYEYLMQVRFHFDKALEFIKRKVNYRLILEGLPENPLISHVEKLQTELKKTLEESRNQTHISFVWHEVLKDPIIVKLAQWGDKAPADLLPIWDRVKGKGEQAVWIIQNDKSTLIGSTHPLVNAGQLFKILAQKHQGKGGGRTDLAQGVLPLKDVDAWRQALQELIQEGLLSPHS